MSDNFKATRWWRVIDSNGDLWCETSSQQEAEDSMRPGDTLQRLYDRTEYRWIEQDAPALRTWRDLRDVPEDVQTVVDDDGEFIFRDESVEHGWRLGGNGPSVGETGMTLFGPFTET